VRANDKFVKPRYTVPRAGCAGTPLRPGWFFLDKIFGGRKVKIVKRKSLCARGKAAEGCRSPKREAFTGGLRIARNVLECASPLALSGGAAKTERELSQLAARIAGMTTGTCSVAPWNGRALRIGDNPRAG
jgi:hypothetical protein